MIYDDRLVREQAEVGADALSNVEQVGKLTGIERNGDGEFRLMAVSSAGNDVRILLQLCAENIVRIRFSYTGKWEDEYHLCQNDWEPVPVELCQSAESVVIASNRVRVTIDREPFSLFIQDMEGNTVFAQHILNKSCAGEFLSIAMGRGVRDSDGIKCVTESIKLRPGESVFGFGERFDALNKTGRRIVTFSQECHGSNPRTSYKPTPFFLSSSGYGLCVNTLEPAAFDVGVRSYESISITKAGEDMDYFVIIGADTNEIIRGYHLITGLPEIPPEWSFGYVQSNAVHRVVDGVLHCGYVTQQEVLEVAERLRREQIPCDCITLDMVWSGGYSLNPEKIFDWAFCLKRFPDPRKMLDGLKEMGFKVCVTQWPYIMSYFPCFQELEQKGLMVRDERGEPYKSQDGHYFLDITNPAAYDWLTEKNRALRELGVVSLMADFCEAYPVDGIYHNGMAGRKAHNLMPILYQRALYDVTQDDTQERGCLWARAGYIGAQKTPGHWAGDNHCSFQSLSAVVRAGLSFGLSGCPVWGHDIGGWFGQLIESGCYTGPSKELFIRWAEFGFFSPWLRTHGGTPREPWAFDEDVLAIIRKYAQFRSRLVPYIYSCALKSRDTGAPIMRAMFLEFPEDPACWALEQQYMLGDALMVAPVYDESEMVRVYFPPGKWQDIWTGQIYEGPCWVKYHAPLETIPVFQRSDTILPLGPVRQYVGESEMNSLELWAFVEDEAEMLLLSDAGKTKVCVKRRAEKLEVVESIGCRFELIDRTQGRARRGIE